MSGRGKTRGPAPRKPTSRLPSDIADAAEVALDDLFTNHGLDDDDDELLTQAIPTERLKAPAQPPKRAETRAEIAAKIREESTVDAAAAFEPTGLPELPYLPDLDDEDATVEATKARASSEISSSSALRVAVLEDSVHLGSVQSAIAAAGHTIVMAASGRDGAKKIIDTLREKTVDVVLVGLQGAGESVIDAALSLEGRRPVVVACLDGNPVAATQRAIGVNADLVAIRPHDVNSLAPLLFAAARLVIERRVTASARGAEQALRARLDELADPEPRGLLPYEMFQRVLELEIRRAKRFEYSLSLALFAVEVAGAPPPPGIRGILRARAGNALIHTIRDIDVATQLDHERFVVLLPYTDLKGASGLARRVISAVAAIDPVITAGRSMSPKLIGAVSSAPMGQSVSFSKLMKDASRALEGARKDGADLAVLP